MERKYQIMSATNIMKMMVNFKDKNEQLYELSVGVDLQNNKVYFEDLMSLIALELDLEDLEQEILAYLRPVGPEMPDFASEIFKKIMNVQSGSYGSEKYGEL